MNHSTETPVISHRLAEIEQLLDQRLDAQRTAEILSLTLCPPMQADILNEARVYAEYLPKAAEFPFTEDQRYLHFLWDAFDRSPLSVAINFAIPFRRMIALRLFRRCGKNFCSEWNVRFNFGRFLELGDNVFFNAGVFIDTKGGVALGSSVGIGEFVRIFTHGHGEADHAERSYAPVKIGDYAKVYAGAMIFPGVTIGEQAIVAAGAIVTKDVPPNMVVAGVPAKVIRERRNGGRAGKYLHHMWLHEGAFQDE
jgi:acetyltransferase-like isoleucine patch superfamily enzyme